jgi:hypothetical protein
MLDVNAGVTAVNPNETEPPLLVKTLEIVQDSSSDRAAVDRLVGDRGDRGGPGSSPRAARWSIR